jgi:hypothetical protein
VCWENTAGRRDSKAIFDRRERQMDAHISNTRREEKLGAVALVVATLVALGLGLTAPDVVSFFHRVPSVTINSQVTAPASVPAPAPPATLKASLPHSEPRQDLEQPVDA